MRTLRLTVITLLMSAPFAPSHALQANDTMKSWKNASPEDRADLLDRILGTRGGAAKVLKCVDDASTITGHSDLPIAEVAKACASSENLGQPV